MKNTKMGDRVQYQKPEGADKRKEKSAKKKRQVVQVRMGGGLSGKWETTRMREAHACMEMHAAHLTVW